MDPSLDPIAIIESINLRSLSDWLQLGTRTANMSQVHTADDDPGSAPPTLTLWFIDRRVTVTGADRLKVLAWLADQVSPDPVTPPS